MFTADYDGMYMYLVCMLEFIFTIVTVLQHMQRLDHSVMLGKRCGPRLLQNKTWPTQYLWCHRNDARGFKQSKIHTMHVLKNTIKNPMTLHLELKNEVCGS